MTRAPLLGAPVGVVVAVLFPSPEWVFSVGTTLWLILCLWRLTLKRFWRNQAVTRRRPGFLAGLLSGLVIASGQLYVHGTEHVNTIGERRVSGCILDAVVSGHGVYRFVFETTSRTWLGHSVRYRVAWYQPAQPPVPGSCWRLTLRLKPLRGARNEAGFDFERWLFAQRLSGLGSVRGAPAAVELPWKSSRAAYHESRMHVYARLTELTGDHTSGKLIAALAVGMRDGLDDNDWDVLRRTGTAHLMAISGLHVGLAAMIGFAIGRYLPLGLHARADLTVRGAVTSLVVATLYAGVAGFAVSTVRALVMLSLWHLWRIAGRSVDVMTTLLMTAAGMLLLCPWMVAEVGFWLSAGAVTAIAASVYGQPPASSIGDRVALAIRIQLGITLLMLPVAVLVAEGVSWASLPVNLILIPLFSVCIVPLVLLLLASLVISPTMAELVATVLGSSLDLIWLLLGRLSEQSWAFSSLSTRSPWVTIPVVVCGAVLLMPRAFPSRWTSCVLVLPLFFLRSEHPDHGQFWLDVLDVGQALAVVVQTRSQVLVYDTGNAWPGGDSAEQVILPVLRRRRTDELHTLIVSHADRDHSGGAVRLQQSLPVKHVWVGEPVDGLVNTNLCMQGIHWQVDGVRFEFLHPPENSTYEGNQQSCVLLVHGSNGRILLTGDLGKALERQLIPAIRERSITVVVGAHHGSLSSSDRRFAAATHPEYVVFSNGYGNQWGMPRDEVVTRWHAAGTRVLTTARSGQLRFRNDRNGCLTLEAQLREHGPGVWRWRGDAD